MMNTAKILMLSNNFAEAILDHLTQFWYDKEM